MFDHKSAPQRGPKILYFAVTILLLFAFSGCTHLASGSQTGTPQTGIGPLVPVTGSNQNNGNQAANGNQSGNTSNGNQSGNTSNGSQSGNASNGNQSSAQQQSSTVQVTEGNYFIRVGQNHVPPGQVTFQVTNKGPAEHELVIVQTDLKEGNLPTSGGKVDMSSSKVTKIVDHPKVAKGTSYSITQNLQPGHYVLICNLPGHYLQGMHASLTVGQQASGGQQASQGGQQSTPQATSQGGGQQTTPQATGQASQGGEQGTPQAEASGTPSAQAAATVSVIENNYHIYIDHDEVPAGMIQFDLRNTGVSEHDFVIVKTDHSAGNLPVQNAQVDLSSSQVQKVASQDAYQPGSTKTLQANLTPGHYVLISNLPNHYQQGMRVNFFVLPNNQAPTPTPPPPASAILPQTGQSGQSGQSSESGQAAATPAPTGTPETTQTQAAATPSATAQASPSAQSGQQSAAKVQVIEESYHIFMDNTTIPAGQVQFHLKNNANQPHEFVLFKTDLSADNLPVQGGKVAESSPKLQKIDEQDQFPAGETRTLTVNLDPGHYVAICNIVGHYQQGMYIDFWVTSPQTGLPVVPSTGLSVTSTPAPTESATPAASTETSTPAPAQSATPAPTETSAPASNQAAAAKVQVHEQSYAILMGNTTIPAGPVEFDLKNLADVPHEFVIFKTDLSADNLPVQNGQVMEGSPKLQKIDEQDQFPAGETRALTVNLDPGHYVAICNIVGHYQQGMRIDFWVTSQQTGLPVIPSTGSSVTSTPAPNETSTPAPNETSAPAPNETSTPAAAQTSAPASSQSALKVQVIEQSYAILMSNTTLPAGRVEFDMKNIADIAHEFVIFKTDLAAQNLPVQNGQVVETSPQLQKIAEQDQYPAGETRALTVNLDPGHYVAICNIVGHYQQGMRVGFWVTASQTGVPNLPSNSTGQ